MTTFAPEDLVACARRELRMRERVYPRWVAQERMQQASADREIALMRAILETLEDIQRKSAPELFS